MAPRNMWNLYVAGTGMYDESLLTNFVTQLRDLGLKITNVEVINGHLHPDLMANAPSGEGDDGWTMYVYGTGDVALAYNEFPKFLKTFRDGGIDVVSSGIATGERREITIGT